MGEKNLADQLDLDDNKNKILDDLNITTKNY